MKTIGFVFAFFFVINFTFCQTYPRTFFQGYTADVQGNRFGYHSPLPNVNTSLLLRGRQDYMAIAWSTGQVPAHYSEEFVHFIWLFGMDVTADPVDFQLHVNNKEWFSFSSSQTSEVGLINYPGKEGAMLSFNVTMLDKHKDQMGFAILKLPVSAIQLGEPNILKITTTSEDNNAWFMTYKAALSEQIDIYQNKVVTKKDGNLFHSISVDFIHLSEDATVKILVGNIQMNSKLIAGFNKVEINLPKVEDTTEYEAEIIVANRTSIRKKFTLTPIRKWEIFLVQHTHTDIGYTRPQTEILPEHLRYIDYALDFCDQTDDYPEAAKFRWTCETSWSVREYLRSRPQAQIDRLLKRIEEGRIEATGMFLNYSEIIDEAALARQTKTLRMLKNSGIDVTTAMQNDVNGIGWAMVDNFQNTDVKYLTMGIHAHRARKPFNKPTSFWWESPTGNRLLAYRSEHYMHGNSLSLTTGQQDVLRKNLSNYLTGLEEKGYPYDKISLQFSGYVTDNSPPSTVACDIIKAWNEQYEWPKLRSALARDFMIYLDEEHDDEMPTQQVAWPDWWTDGVGSAANETKVVRQTHAHVSAVTAILSMAKLKGVTLPSSILQDVEIVYDNLLFYDEHTHGASESVSDPLAQNTINQWGMKSSYAWEAAKKSHVLQEKALAYFEPTLNKSSRPTIVVFNTLNWNRSGMVNLFIQHEAIPPGVDFAIRDMDGNQVPYQKYQQREEGTYYGLWVENIPAFGYKTLQINLGSKSSKQHANAAVGDNYLENEFYRLVIDPQKGVVSSIYDKNLKKELVDPNDTVSLGQFIYEELSNRHDLERLTNTTRDTVYRPLNLSRTMLANPKIYKTEKGSIYHSIFLHGDMPKCTDERGVDIEVRMYHFKKMIELKYRIFKLPVTTPESVYVTFPFLLNNGLIEFEVQGGIVSPGKNQLAGSSSDWNTIQNFAAIKNDESQIVFVSNEIPLVQFGDINIGRYYYRLNPKTNHIYSWVLNNYWVTNFKASQKGELTWDYQLTSSGDNSNKFATQFGWGESVPLISRVLMPIEGVDQTELNKQSLLNLQSPNLLLVNASPSMDDEGIVLHIREVEGNHAILDIGKLIQESGATSIQEVNVLEEALTPLSVPLLFEHFETKFIKLNFK